jgi:hypothetical protein
MNPVNTLPPYIPNNCFNIILPSVLRSSFQVCQPNFCTHSLAPSCLLHAQLISSFLIWSSRWYLVACINYEVPHLNFLQLPVMSSSLGKNVLRPPQVVFFPSCERPSFTAIQNNWQSYSFIYFNLNFRQHMGGNKIVNYTAASNPQI